MIRKWIVFVLSSAILLALFLCFAENKEQSRPRVSLSAPSGFYQDGLFLELKGENGDIYYTLDGSSPDRDSIRYEGGFFIGDASENDNVYSLRDDLSVSFMDDVIHEREAGSPEDYVVPDKKVDKCTVVRAVCIDPLGGRSEEAMGAYFVGFDTKEGYDGVHVVSLTVDPADLFDYEKGIYVTGKATADYLESGERVLNDDNWWWWPANYRMKGKDWERPAHMEIYDEGRELLLARDIGIRVQGGGSRAYLPRSLSLIASEKYDGMSTFGVDLFGTGFAPREAILFSGGDSRITKLEDYLPAVLCSDRAFDSMRYIPAVMFLNGEYWGFYFLTEKYDEGYFEGHYGVDPSDLAVIKEGEVSIGTQADLRDYEDDMRFLKNVDMSREGSLEAVAERIDLDSYLDYYAVQLYIDRRNDWPYMNVAAWRSRSGGTVGAGTEDLKAEGCGAGSEDLKAEGYGAGSEGLKAEGYGAGCEDLEDEGYGAGCEDLKAEGFGGGAVADRRWRWLLFDDNSGSYGPSSISSNSVENTRAVDPVFDNLMKSPELYESLRKRMFTLAQNEFEPSRVREFVEDYRQLVTPVMKNEFDRFYGDKRDYEKSLRVRLDRFEEFFDGRAEYVMTEMFEPGD